MKAQKRGSATALSVMQCVHEVRPGIQDTTIRKQNEADIRILLWRIVKLWKVLNLTVLNRSVGNAGNTLNFQPLFQFLPYSEENVNM
jgi:hypothetical protein